MKLKELSNSELLEASKDAVQVETVSTTNVVRCFREIYDRGLHLELGYSSMFIMAVKFFGYDNASAQRRASAMELSIEVPAVLEMIDHGSHCLQSVADMQKFLNGERGAKRPYSLEQKNELVETCAGLSTRMVQRELAKRNPIIDFRESKKFVSKDRLPVTYTCSVELEKKLAHIKDLLSHVNPYMNREELLAYMVDCTLEMIDPDRKDARLAERKERKRQLPAPEVEFTEEVVSEGGEIQLTAFSEPRSRYIKAAEDRKVRAANEGKGCAYVDPKTGQRCGSTHQLQRDHIIEYSKGGSNEAENLQMFCAQHNRYRWRSRSRLEEGEIAYQVLARSNLRRRKLRRKRRRASFVSYSRGPEAAS